MIYGIGIDLTEIKRIKQAQQKNSGFAQKVLTDNELKLFVQYSGTRQLEFLAGRFAVKEAYSKAYGTGIGRVSFQEIETLTEASGKPVLTQHPFAGQAFVSIAHTAESVVAQVILESRS